MAPPGVSMASPSSSGDAPTVDTPPDAFGDVFSATRHSAPRMPERVGRYHLIKLLGEGGMGAVYKAEQREPIKRLVALKLVRAGHESQAILKRFDSERQALARMDHPSVAKVLDAGADDNGLPFFVMEFVPGEPITEFADKRKLSIKARLELFIQVCEGISHAHSKALLHRDIKAQNVLAYENDGKYAVKVIDFGIAKAVGEEKLTNATLTAGFGSVLGTPQTMSPEQAEGSIDLDTRTDVFALGVLLYELIGGRLPLGREELQNKTIHQVLEMVRLKEAPNLSTWLARDPAKAEEIAKARDTRPAALIRQLKRELECIPLKAMRKDRDRRYQSVQKLSEDIQNYLQGRPITAGPESKLYVARKFVGRNKLRLAVVAAVAATMIGGTTAYTLKIREERDIAQKMNMVAAEELEFNKSIIRQASPEDGADGLTIRQAVNNAATTFASSEQFGSLEPSARCHLLVEMGAIARDIGAFDLAASDLNLGLEACLKVYTADSVWTASVYTELAKLKEDQHLLDEAEAYGRKAISIYERSTIPTDQVLFPRTLSNLGMCRLDRGDYDGATKLLNRAMSIVKQTKPIDEDHRRQLLEEEATLLKNLGGVEEKQQKYDSALEYAKRSFELIKQLYGPRQLPYAEIEMNVGNAYSAAKNFDLALPMLREAMAHYSEYAGPDWIRTIRCREAYAYALRNSGDLQGAESQYRQCLTDLKKNPNLANETAGDIAAVDAGLGRTLLSIRGRETEAEAPLLASFDYRTKNCGPNDQGLARTRSGLEDVEKIYQDNNQLDKAKHIHDVLNGTVKIGAITREAATRPVEGK